MKKKNVGDRMKNKSLERHMPEYQQLCSKKCFKPKYCMDGN